MAWGSDHLPVLLNCSRGWKYNKRDMRVFRYEMSWDNEDECGKVVERAWKCQTIGVQNKLNSCRQALCHWSKRQIKKWVILLGD